MLPERIVAPPPWVGHIPFAFWIIDVMRPRRFVELGTHSGNSFCAFLQAAATAVTPGEYFAVDDWRGDDHAGGYDNGIYEDLRRYTETRYHRSSALLRMTFDRALAGFADGSIDLLHIDGLHTYAAVRHDFDAWLPKMSERGVVLLHDTAVRERDFGVYQLFAELAERYPTFQFVHSHGLGVVQTGTAVPPEPLASLLRGEPDSRGIDPRLYFERLGNSLVDRYYFEELAKQLEVELENMGRRKQQLATALASPFDSAKRILSSGFFDPEAYRKNAGVPDVHDLSLAQHYLDVGEAAQLAPSRHFDPRFYSDKYPDVARAGLNMLFHYVTFGRAEGRLPKKPNIAGEDSAESVRTEHSPD
ncbi:class I SAM-dependent methyltransferase [Bradyrhizobium sp. S3.12.5]|uniref:class I SAM-dependent methyltransferase n=1 Tax=Bradyrhizobium sp. S3.12.5 TaxID=3156386 RepID=UPI0033965AB1